MTPLKQYWNWDYDKHYKAAKLLHVGHNEVWPYRYIEEKLCYRISERVDRMRKRAVERKVGYA